MTTFVEGKNYWIKIIQEIQSKNSREPEKLNAIREDIILRNKLDDRAKKYLLSYYQAIQNSKNEKTTESYFSTKTKSQKNGRFKKIRGVFSKIKKRSKNKQWYFIIICIRLLSG